MSDLKDRYPRTIVCGGEKILLERLDSLDGNEVREFTSGLSDHDLLFLSRDIREPKVIDAWSRSLGTGELVTITARRDGRIVGTTAVVMDPLSWSAHVGELRILLGAGVREIGLGRQLIQESFLMGLDLGLEKLTVRMTLDQERAMTVFEEMGFKTEALLRNHVKDSHGVKHDLIIMSHDVSAVQSMMELYGLDQAF